MAAVAVVSLSSVAFSPRHVSECSRESRDREHAVAQRRRRQSRLKLPLQTAKTHTLAVVDSAAPGLTLNALGALR